MPSRRPGRGVKLVTVGRRAARPGRLRGLRRRDAGAGRARRRDRADEPPHGRGLGARRPPARHARRAPAARVRPGPAGPRPRRGDARVRPIEHVDLVGRDAATSTALVVAPADVICCCTTAREPLFDGEAGRRPRHRRRDRLPRARRARDRRRAGRAADGRRRVAASALREAGDVIWPSPRVPSRGELVTLRGAGARRRRPRPATPAAVQEHGDGVGGRRGRGRTDRFSPRRVRQPGRGRIGERREQVGIRSLRSPIPVAAEIPPSGSPRHLSGTFLPVGLS